MRIFQRGVKGIYCVEFMVNGERVLKSLKTTDRKEAEREAKKIFVSHSALVVPKKEIYRISNAINDLYHDRWHVLPKGKEYLSSVTAVMQLIGDRDINTLTVKDFNDFYPKTRGLWKPNTTNNKIALFKAVLNYAKENGHYQGNAKFKPLPEKKTKLRFLTEEEEFTIYNILLQHNRKVASFFKILINTGLRPSELLSVRTKDYRGNYLDVYASKVDKSRSIPLNGKARTELDKCVVGLDKQALIFNFCLAAAQKHFVKYVHSTFPDLKGYGYHLCRHTAASRLVQQGVSIYKVQQLLGHSSVQVTAKYSHLRDGDLEEIVELL